MSHCLLQPHSNLLLLRVAVVIVAGSVIGNPTAFGCTTAIATGNAVGDGRPIVWRNFDWSGNVTVYRCAGGRYAYISPSPRVPDHGAGTNVAGLAIYTTLMKQMNPIGTPHFATPAMSWLLGNCATVAEVGRAIDEQVRFEKGEPGGVQHWDASQKAPALSLAAIDAHGGAAIFELGKKSFFEYDLNAPNRLAAQPAQIAVRANVPHKRADHLDNATTGGPRYTDARDALLRLAADQNKLTWKEVISGISRWGDPAAETRRICSRHTIACTVVWGCRPGEDPRLTTVLTTLGNPAYGVFVPVWAAASDRLNERYTSSDDNGISEQVARLLRKRIEGLDVRVRARTAEFENGLFSTIESVRAHWSRDGFDPVMARRLSNEAGETVWRMIHSMNAAEGDALNRPPTFDSFSLDSSSLDVSASCAISDEGEVTSITWNFGDGATAVGARARHRYRKPGTYLVSCAADDDRGSRNSRWCLLVVGPTGQEGLKDHCGVLRTRSN